MTNIQGDVIAILNSSGNPVATYSYDAWGNLLSETDNSENGVGTLNPLRYRGYVYDQETGLYYVSSRYYDSEIGRWISPEPNVYAGAFDSGSGLIGYNVYAYCANNPILFIDVNGEFVATAAAFFLAISVKDAIIIIAGALVTGVAVELLSDILSQPQTAFSKGRNKRNPDPYARPNQKKQGRENKNKNRKKDNYMPHNNRRDGKPAPPKHHTPGRDHQKFSQSRNAEFYMFNLR